MSLKKKMETLLEAYPGFGANRESDAPAQGSSKKAEVEVLLKGSGAGKSVRDPGGSKNTLRPKVGAFEAKPARQGDSKDSPVEDLDSENAGKKAFEKGKPRAGLTARGPGNAPNFKTVADPTSVINKKSSSGNVAQEETETEEELVDEEETVENELEEKFEKKGKKEEDDDDDDDDEEDDNDKKEKKAEAKKKFSESLASDVNNLFAGEVDLTEDFKAKAVALFEAAVVARVAHEIELVEDAVAAKAVEIIAENNASIVEQVDEYLSYVAEQWVEKNELEVSNMIRTEIAENFMESLRNVFAENYIEVPDEKVDVLEQMEEHIRAVEAERDEVLEDANELADALIALKRDAVISSVTEGLAKTEVEKLVKLTEEVAYEDDVSFKEKIEMVKKNIFGKATAKVASFVDGEEEVTSETVPEGTDPEIERIVANLSPAQRF